jgi:MerR family copper efflux transcriptional regulator
MIPAVGHKRHLLYTTSSGEHEVKYVILKQARKTMDATTQKEQMTIGELAAHFGLATHVLRHWEAVGLLTPAARVNGRRRYQQADVARVAMIVRGKEAGFGLAQLREMFEAPDPQSRRAVVERHHAALERRIAERQAAMAMVEHVLDCHVGDFAQCPDFQRLVQRIEAGDSAQASAEFLKHTRAGPVDRVRRGQEPRT